MSIEHLPAGERRILVTVDGRLDRSLSPALEEKLNSLLAEGQHELLVDLSGVDYVNSGGLRVLAGAWRRARQAGGDLRLCGLRQRVKETIEMVGFDQVFEIYETRKLAESNWPG